MCNSLPAALSKVAGILVLGVQRYANRFPDRWRKGAVTFDPPRQGQSWTVTGHAGIETEHGTHERSAGWERLLDYRLCSTCSPKSQWIKMPASGLETNVRLGIRAGKPFGNNIGCSRRPWLVDWATEFASYSGNATRAVTDCGCGAKVARAILRLCAFAGRQLLHHPAAC